MQCNRVRQRAENKYTVKTVHSSAGNKSQRQPFREARKKFSLTLHGRSIRLKYNSMALNLLRNPQAMVEGLH